LGWWFWGEKCAFQRTGEVSRVKSGKLRVVVIDILKEENRGITGYPVRVSGGVWILYC